MSMKIGLIYSDLVQNNIVYILQALMGRLFTRFVVGWQLTEGPTVVHKFKYVYSYQS